MKILHTSDWHLGKTLEGRDRIEEQKEFLDELAKIADENKIDLILISGDVYDTYNPSARAETLFYESLNKLRDDGKRAIVIIAGNHDSPDRLKASSSLVKLSGVFVLGYPYDNIGTFADENLDFACIDSEESYLEIKFKKYDYTAKIIALAYPSEFRLNELLSKELDENKIQKSYSEKIKMINQKLNKKFSRDSVNLFMSHFFVLGGRSSDSERTLSVGGTYTVNKDALPKDADYIALGHLHKPQKIGENAFFSGSPLAYSFSEAGQSKQVNIIEIIPNDLFEIRKVDLSSGKPLVLWDARKGFSQALEWAKSSRDKNAWIDLSIHIEEPLTNNQIKDLKTFRPDIVNIKPILKSEKIKTDFEDRLSLPIDTLFENFYKEKLNAEPKEDLVQLFLNMLEKGEEA